MESSSLDPDVADPSEMTVAQKTMRIEMSDMYWRLQAALENNAALNTQIIQLRNSLSDARQHLDVLLRQQEQHAQVGGGSDHGGPRPSPTAAQDLRAAMDRVTTLQAEVKQALQECTPAMERVTTLLNEVMLALKHRKTEMDAEVKRALQHGDAAIARVTALEDEARRTRSRPVVTAIHVVAMVLIAVIVCAMTLSAILARLDDLRSPCVCSCVFGGDAIAPAAAAEDDTPARDAWWPAAWPELRAWVAMGLGRLLAIANGGGADAPRALLPAADA